MNACPVCQLAFTPASAGGPCPRCSLLQALHTPEPAATPDADAAADYDILSELGRGSMGVVSLARQRSLDRLVALKVVATGGRPTAWLEARLLREARAAAALNHPHIVAVYDIGRHAQGAYFAMEYCAGGDLRERLRARPLAPPAAASLVRKLADAVATAHAAGVIHRDLKPGNVLLTEAGEPKISDFGLTSTAGGGDLTRTGEVAGSPSYLAPEALDPASRPAPAQDIYGLGAILYECVTGRAPFVGASTAAILAQIARADPPPPRLLLRTLPRDLDTIILKCLAKAPAARYATAAALADDLGRFLDGRPIRARPVSPLGRASRWARRNPALAAALAFIVLGTTVSAGLLAERGRRLAAALDTAERAGAATRAALADALVAQARATRESGRQGQRHATLALLQRAASLQAPGEVARTEALAALALDDWRWSAPRAFRSLRMIHTVGFDADLRLAAVPAETVGDIDIVDSATGSVQRRLVAPAGAAAEVWQTWFGPDPGWVLAEYRDSLQCVWGPGDTAPRWSHRPADGAYCGFHASTDGRGWWFTTTGNQLRWHDAATGREEDVGSPGEPILAVSPSPAGDALAVTRDDRLEVWDLAPLRLRWQRLGDVGYAAAAWASDGRRLVTERYEGSPALTVWSAADGTDELTFRGGQRRATQLVLHPDDRRLLSLDADGVLRLWDLNSGRELVRGEVGPHGVRIARDGRGAVGSSAFQTLARLEFAPLETCVPLTLEPGRGSIWRYADASDDGRWLAGITRTSLRTFDRVTGREGPRHEFVRADTSTLAFQTDGTLLFSGAQVGIRSLRPGGGPVWNETELEPSGGWRLLDTVASKRLWAVQRGNEPLVEVWPEGDRARAIRIATPVPSPSVALSPDGRWVVLTSVRSTEAWLHALPGGERRATLPVEGSALGRFSVDGRWLVLGAPQGYAIWALDDMRQPVHTLAHDQRGSPYGYCTFSPDGRWFAYMTGPSTVAFARPGVWTAELVFTLPAGGQRDAWTWTDGGRTLHVFSGRNDIYALQPDTARARLRDLGL